MDIMNLKIRMKMAGTTTGWLKPLPEMKWVRQDFLLRSAVIRYFEENGLLGNVEMSVER